MKVTALTIDGKNDNPMELPSVFDTPIRYKLIHSAFVSLNSHKFQKQGRHPTAGQDVVADSNDPPTGRGISRIARMKGGGGGRQGQAGEVASTRGGRQAFPPNVKKVIYKKLNKKENKLALCSAIAATASKEIVKSNGHSIENIKELPIIVSDEIENISKTSEMEKIIKSLNLINDIKRLEKRKPRSGKVALRGRKSKVGKSVLFVVSDSSKTENACSSIPGVDARSVKDLSILDLAPGSKPVRLTVYSKKAIDEISKIKSSHLELMVAMKWILKKP